MIDKKSVIIDNMGGSVKLNDKFSSKATDIDTSANTSNHASKLTSAMKNPAPVNAGNKRASYVASSSSMINLMKSNGNGMGLAKKTNNPAFVFTKAAS